MVRLGIPRYNRIKDAEMPGIEARRRSVERIRFSMKVRRGLLRGLGLV